MAHSIIDIENLQLSLIGGAGPVNILCGIDLKVRRGETISVVGPSGAGKTTLLMALSGLEKPTSGRVRVAGTDLQQLDEDGLARFRRQQVGIVFQSFHLVSTMTALENVALPLEFAGADDSLERARAALDSTGLADRLDHFPGELSGGEQQRVALARAFVARPALILADEPTGNLDSTTGREVLELLRGGVDELGWTVVMVTHDPNAAMAADRIVFLRDGRLTGEASTKSTDIRSVIESYGGI